MAAIFIEPLAQDSESWEIIGIRNLIFDDKLSTLQAEVYCFSTRWDCWGKLRRKFKSFYTPIGYLKYLSAGSIWRCGVEVRLARRAYHMGDILAHKCELITSKETLTNEQLLKKLRASNNFHRTFLNSINYLKYEHSQRDLYIPCSEVIRHFFAPSQRFLNHLLTGKIDRIINPKMRLDFGFSPSTTEMKAIRLLSACETGLAATRHPYKSIKLTHLNNVHKRENQPFLLSAILPTTGILAVWSYRAQPAHTSDGLAFVVTNLESEPQHGPAQKFRERNPMSRDFGPHDFFR